MRASLMHHLEEAFEENNVANELLESMLSMEEACLCTIPERDMPSLPTRARAIAMSFLWCSPLGMGLSQNLKIRASQILDLSCRVAQEEMESRAAFIAAAGALMLAAKVEPSMKNPTHAEWTNMCSIASDVSAGVGCGVLSSTDIEAEESELLRMVVEVLAAPTAQSWMDVFGGRFEVVLQGRTLVDAEDIARVVSRASAFAADIVYQSPIAEDQPPFVVALGCFILALLAEGLITQELVGPQNDQIDAALANARVREEQRRKQQRGPVPAPPREWGWQEPPRLMFPALLVAAGCDESAASRATCKVAELLSC